MVLWMRFMMLVAFWFCLLESVNIFICSMEMVRLWTKVKFQLNFRSYYSLYCLLRSMSEVLPPQILRHFVTTVMIASDWLTLEIVDRSTCCLKRTQKAKLLVKQWGWPFLVVVLGCLEFVRCRKAVLCIFCVNNLKPYLKYEYMTAQYLDDTIIIWSWITDSYVFVNLSANRTAH